MVAVAYSKEVFIRFVSDEYIVSRFTLKNVLVLTRVLLKTVDTCIGTPGYVRQNQQTGETRVIGLVTPGYWLTVATLLGTGGKSPDSLLVPEKFL